MTKVKQALDEGRSKLEGKATIEEERWDGDTLNFGVHVQGQSIAGTLRVEEHQFVLDAKLPLLWRMFEGKIESAVKENLDRFL